MSGARRSLFWDVPSERIDPVEHASWIIARVLSFGTWSEIQVLFGLYGKHKILESVQSSRSITDSARDLWMAVLTEGDADMLHMETLAESAKELLLNHGEILVPLRCILCGGTAMALRFGHRSSVDLDFLTDQAFDAARVWESLSSAFPTARLVERRQNTLHAEVNGVAVSYIRQPGARLSSDERIGSVPLADLATLAALKVNAVTNRGSRKDFIDLYALCQNGWTVGALLAVAAERLPSLDRAAAIRSLTYFADADSEPMPTMMIPWRWEDIKRYFQKHVLAYLRSTLGSSP